MKQKILTLWNNFLNLFFPRLCLLCDEVLIEGEDELCLKCLAELPRTNYDSHLNNPVAQRFLGRCKVVEATAFCHFVKEGNIQKIIHEFKYHNQKRLAYVMGRQAGKWIIEKNMFTDIDMLVPVPLHKSRQSERGYNQSEWIAKGLAETLGKPIDATTLCRWKKTQTQTHKTNHERWLSVQDAFKIIDAEKFRNKHILLIDDVLTTGATFESCCLTLEKVSGLKISIFALSMA